LLGANDARRDSDADQLEKLAGPAAPDNPPPFISVIPEGERIWAIPSIHGDAEALKQRHRELAQRFGAGRDRIVYLGNYMGHGGAIKETLDEIVRFRRELLSRPGVEPDDIVLLRGAQEEMWSKLLKLQIATEPFGVLAWMMQHGVEATLIAYGSSAAEALARCREGTMALTRWTGNLRRKMQAEDGHFELLTQLARAAYTSDHSLFFVHASVDPSRPLSLQEDIFWWDTGTFDQVDAAFAGFRKVIRGYDHAKRPPVLDQEYRASIDAGAGFGGPLAVVGFDPDGNIIDIMGYKL